MLKSMPAKVGQGPLMWDISAEVTLAGVVKKNHQGTKITEPAW